jgi:cellulose synthase/poly-beta-1,6-N-acetylglucosamine synthase-like glycosyltransferase
MVDTYYIILLGIFGIVLMLIIIDPNVGMYIDLQLQNLAVETKRRYYLITMGSVIKYQNWKLKREVKKILEENEKRP